VEKVEISTHSLQLKSEILFEEEEQVVRLRNGAHGLVPPLEKIRGALSVLTNHILQLYVLRGLTPEHVVGG
jgi:hypothetical protein